MVDLRLIRHAAQTAADPEFKTAFAFANHGDGAYVVNAHQTAGFIAATGERDLEFASVILGAGVAQQVVSDGAGVGSDVERFRAAHARQRAGGDVADRIAASFARGDARCGKPAL